MAEGQGNDSVREDNSALLDQYTDCAKKFIDLVKDLDHIKGASKLQRMCRSELKYLQTVGVPLYRTVVLSNLQYLYNKYGRFLPLYRTALLTNYLQNSRFTAPPPTHTHYHPHSWNVKFYSIWFDLIEFDPPPPSAICLDSSIICMDAVF